VFLCGVKPVEQRRHQHVARDATSAPSVMKLPSNETYVRGGGVAFQFFTLMMEPVCSA
jgi:hypothetical protein